MLSRCKMSCTIAMGFGTASLPALAALRAFLSRPPSRDRTVGSLHPQCHPSQPLPQKTAPCPLGHSPTILKSGCKFSSSGNCAFGVCRIARGLCGYSSQHPSLPLHRVSQLCSRHSPSAPGMSHHHAQLCPLHLHVPAVTWRVSIYSGKVCDLLSTAFTLHFVLLLPAA